MKCWDVSPGWHFHRIAFFFCLVQLILQPQIIRDHCNKFRICGLSAIILNCIPKIRIKRIHVTSIPRDLNGVADSTLDTRGSSLIFLRNGGVENFCYTVYHVAIFNRQENCRAQILVSFDVRGYSFALFFTGFIALFIGVNS